VITGADLRKAREGQRVSLARLAQMINRDKGHLSRVETGSGRDVTPALVRDYERALGITIGSDPTLSASTPASPRPRHPDRPAANLWSPGRQMSSARCRNGKPIR
jgi:transcriptional regulator with XRE-family HTH domain